ncbi:ABC transporter ATP-binding protein [Streptomyces sp. KR80]|uniref:ABC transporter ATP-binding protein n=1 Tax=Streptomyces sp. KR80 TaxID=3457426 RepID=UPI003FD637F0
MHGDSAAAADGLMLRGLTVRFGGVVALSDVSFHVPPQGVTGLIGPNGSGKTTLFNAVCGFVRPDSGSMLWRGVPLRPKPHRLTRIGIARTLQGVGLFHGLTVLENVIAAANHTARTGFFPALCALPRSDREETRLRTAALAALDRVGLADDADRSPSALPFALRKRVALARALAAQPRLLLLDEPAGGLDDDDIEDLAALLRSLPQQGTAVMVVEHHMDFVMEVCGTVAVLDFGRLIAQGSPREIRSSQAVADAYLGTIASRATDHIDLRGESGEEGE